MDDQTLDPITQHYLAMMDSISVIEGLQALKIKTEDEQDRLERNLAHIKIMLNKAFDWSGFDMTRIDAQISNPA